jgi:hypothetical protein
MEILSARQGEIECGVFSRFRLDPDPAAVYFDNSCLLHLRMFAQIAVTVPRRLASTGVFLAMNCCKASISHIQYFTKA